MPERVQLRRTKGWRMPPNTVKVDRTTKWGNPFVVDHENDSGPMGAVIRFRVWANVSPGYLDKVREALRGKNLACWCKPGAPCHADVLLELANAE
jgi:hypothetical protein